MVGESAVRHLQTGFIGGELDPLLSGRVETDQYSYGLELCENFVAVNEGPIVKRPGFEYICPAAPTASWLGAFRFSIDQEYVIEWSEGAARFYTNGGRIETSPGVPYQLAVPYAAADAHRLSTQQSYDRLYIDHANYPPGSLLRTSASTFSHGFTDLRNGPFLDANTDQAVTVTASGADVGAAITLGASAAIFAATDVGSLFRIEARDYSSVKSWEPGMKDVAVGEMVRSDGKVYRAQTSGSTGSNPPSHEDGSEWDGQLKSDLTNDKGPFGIQWLYLHDRFGIVRITGFTSGTEVAATVVRRLPEQVITVPTWRWAHSAFSATRGWPSLVTHCFGRQIHIKGFDVIGSVVGDYGGGQCNFATYTGSGILAADLSFRRTLSIADVPLWAVDDNDKLLAGTASTELAIGAVNSGLAVSGDNIKGPPQSRYGSEPVFPVQVGTDTIFVERGGRRLRSADFNFSSDRYTPVDITASSRHITRGGLLQLATQRIPYQLLYGVRGDGQLVVHANTRLEIKGFARTVLGGGARALSAVSVVGADNKTDELWLLVERAGGDGSPRREIWRQTDWRELGTDQREAFYVDCGTRVAAAGGQASFAGFTHLAGQSLAILANGGVVPGITAAADGSFSLPPASVPAAPYTLIVGLGYTATAVTLRPPARNPAGYIQGLRQRVRKVVLRLIETVGIRVGGFLSNGAAGRLENMIDRPASAHMDAAIPLFTGDAGVSGLDTEINRDGRTRFVSADPLPAIITAAMLSIEVDENDA